MRSPTRMTAGKAGASRKAPAKTAAAKGKGALLRKDGTPDGRTKAGRAAAAKKVARKAARRPQA